MTELLIWLSKRLDPDFEYMDGPYNTEQDRVLLMRTAAQFFVSVHTILSCVQFMCAGFKVIITHTAAMMRYVRYLKLLPEN